jgi:D-amino-acid dehydrogenase
LIQTVIVIGGGLAGVATAYQLGRRGYRTILYEMRDGVALETSYANGGLLVPSMADPWNAPGVHWHLAASLFKRHSAIKVGWHEIPSLAGWGVRFLCHSSPTRHRAATKASFLLAKYSVERTRDLRVLLSLSYDATTVGTIKVFRTRSAMEEPLKLAAMLAPLGLRFDVLDAQGAIAAEPALAEIRGQIAGALRFPDDEAGDAQQFCEKLAAAFVREGGVSRTSTSVTGIAVERGSISGVCIGDKVERANAVVVAAGNSSAKLVRHLGVFLPICPAKGYTVTFDASHVEGRPLIPIIDDALHAAVIPIGTRLRIAGTAEFAGSNLQIRQDRIGGLLDLLAAILPRIAAQLPGASGQPWTGLRPMSADGLPFIGLTHVRGLYVNTGHGHLGWTFAVGSAQLLADLIDGRVPDIDPTPYEPTR